MLDSLWQPSFGLIRVEYDSSEIADVYPNGFEALLPSQRAIVCGRLLVNESRVILHYGYPGGATVKRRFVIRGSTRNSGLVPRYWASQRLLNDDSVANVPFFLCAEIFSEVLTKFLGT